MGDVRITDDTTAVIISDASVLIDYYLADRRILSLIIENLGTIVVPRQVFDEVEQIDEAEAEDLGLIVIEPEYSQVTEASARGGPLSRADKLILILARDNNYICWTNDSHLRKRCVENSIRVYWGLEIMFPLCEGGHLPEHDAIRTGRSIYEINRFYITDEILQRFENRVRSIFMNR